MIYFSLGSNIGDRMKYLDEARNMLEAHGIVIVKASRVYETEPFYKEDGAQWFLNQVVSVQSELSSQGLLKIIQEIERHLGRTVSPVPHVGPRCIDIDILLYGDEVIDLPDLQIPHAQLHHRRFALVPLLEIAPELKDPVSGRTFKEILSECKDEHRVVSFS